MQVTFDFNNEKLSRSLGRLSLKVKDFKPFHEGAVELIQEHSDKVFDTEGGALENYSRWKPLSASTKRARKNRSGHYAQQPNNPHILRWTGKLQDTVKKIANSDYGSIERTTSYAKYHLKGRNARVFAELDNGTKAEIVRLLQKMAEKQIQAFNNARI